MKGLSVNSLIMCTSVQCTMHTKKKKKPHTPRICNQETDYSIISEAVKEKEI